MRTVTVKVYERGYSNNPPEKLLEFQKWLEDQIAAIPDEFRDSAVIEIGAEAAYDWPSMTMVITYSRPENDEERAAREREEARNAEAQKAHEIALLRKLKAKYDQ